MATNLIMKQFLERHNLPQFIQVEIGDLSRLYPLNKLNSYSSKSESFSLDRFTGES